MNSSENKIVNIRAKDPFDILIHEKGLRIKRLFIDKDLDLMIVIFNNGKIVKSRISYYERLRGATQEQLDKWKLISNGVGVTWEELDEDLSAKGFIKNSALNNALSNLLHADGGEELLV